MDGDQQRRAEHERRGVERERLTGADAEHQRGRERRAEQEGEVGHRLRQRAGVLDHRLGHGLREQARVRGLEERLRRPERRLDHHQLPDLHRAAEDQRGQQRVQPGADQVGDNHDPVALQTVGPHAPEQQQQHERQRLRGEH